MLNLKDANVLITGGTGSFGKKCVEYLLKECPPHRLVIFSRDEQKHVTMSRNLFPEAKFPQLRYFVGDVRDEARLRRALHGIDYVIHAAAMKHVDIAEYNPQECIRTNIGGAENLINACIDSGVRKLVALSTDKAANPINLYGATKLCSDKLFIAANSLSGTGGTRFSVVRYGNVLGSNGSVVPFFMQQRKKGVLPITDPRMTRFIITLSQGVELVMKAFDMMTGGEVFVPKIPSARVVDIATAIAPECRQEVIGIRPGEKLHECMIPGEESRQSMEFDDFYVIHPSFCHWNTSASKIRSGMPCAEGFSYSSDTNSQWLSTDDLAQLIKQQMPAGQDVNQTRMVKAA